MGGMWTSLTVRAASQEAVVAVLRKLHRTAFVGPCESGWVSVFDEQCEQQSETDTVGLGCDVTRLLGMPGLAILVHDGDMLCSWVFRDGNLIDRYDSWPGYFHGLDPRPQGGDAKAACKALGLPDCSRRLHEALHEADDYTDGLTLHERILGALGLPETSLGLGYGYVARGEAPPGATFAHVRQPPRATPGRDAAERKPGPRAVPSARREAEAELPRFVTVLEGAGRLEATLASLEKRVELIHPNILKLQLPLLAAIRDHAAEASDRDRAQALIAAIEGKTDAP